MKNVYLLFPQMLLLIVPLLMAVLPLLTVVRLAMEMGSAPTIWEIVPWLLIVEVLSVDQVTLPSISTTAPERLFFAEPVQAPGK